ncbi:ATP-binding cassette sub-family C member 9-like isoform X2 [Branchiostoma floridae x Branchiostoma belcheri]
MGQTGSLFCGPAYLNSNATSAGQLLPIRNSTEGQPKVITADQPFGNECLVDGLNLIPHVGFLPLAVLCAALYARCCRHGNSYQDKRAWVLFPGHHVRWVITFVLLFVTLCEVGEGVLSDSFTPGHHPHLYVPWILAFPATILAGAFYHQIEMSNWPRLLPLLGIYNILSVVFKFDRLHHLVGRGVGLGSLRLDLTIASIILYLLMVLLEGYVMYRKRYLTSHPISDPVPEDLLHRDVRYVLPYVTLPSRITQSWHNWLMRLGYKVPLQFHHLGKLPQDYHAKPVYHHFREVYEREKEKAAKNKKSVSLWKVIFLAFSRQFMKTGLLKLTSDIFTFINPLLLRGIITAVIGAGLAAEGGTAVQQGPYLVSLGEFLGNGYILLVLLLLCTLLKYTFEQMSVFLNFQQGVQLRTAMQTLVYTKILRLSSWVLGSGKVTAGQVMNHVSMDGMMLMFFAALFHHTWSMVLQTVAGAILLYYQLGWSALIGASIILCMLPVNYKIARQLEIVTKTKLAVSDQRMKRINETIQGIKLLKLYGWEHIFSDNVITARNKEVKQMYRRAFWEILTLFITQVTPVTATLIAFGTYEFFSHKQLTSADAFTALSLFNIMAMPLIIFPIVIRTMTNARVAIERLVPFLESAEVEAIGDMSRADVDGEGKGGRDGEDEHRNTERDSLLNGHEQIELTKHTPVEGELSDDVAIQVRNGSFTWELDSEVANVSNINLSIPKGKLTIVVGQVGCGKSSLLSAILGEMTTLSGQVVWNKKHNKVAYAAQRPWLLNASLRDNVIFGLPFDRSRYQQVITACCLQPDIDILPGGDMTEIGEKGINLSGGQKQRISVARTLYAKTDIVFLDDPLSALDAHVGGDLFEKGIMGHLVRERRTVVLVTHKLQYLEHAHFVVAMDGGQIQTTGSMREIRESNPELYNNWKDIILEGHRKVAAGLGRKERERLLSHSSVGSRSSLQSGGSMSGSDDEEEASAEAERAKLLRQLSRQFSAYSVRSRVGSVGSKVKEGEEEEQEEEEAAKGKLVKQEERNVGEVALTHYLTYAAACGLVLVAVVLFLQVSKQGMQVGIDFWLSTWSSASTVTAMATTPVINMTAVNQTSGNLTQLPPGLDTSYYINGYTALSVTAILLAAVSSIISMLSMVVGAKRLHEGMVRNIVLAPMRFFDTTPTGRVLNRMSEDQSVIDIRLPFQMEALIRTSLMVTSALVVNAVVTPYFIIGAVPIVILYYFVQKFFRATARELQRLDSINKSPVFAHVSETLGGLSTIRAFRVEKRFKDNIMEKVNRSNTPFYFLTATNSWVGLRMGYMGGVIVFVAGLSAMVASIFGAVSSGMVGLSITYALNLQQYLHWVVRNYCEVEMMMNAVERITFYSTIPTEQYRDRQRGNVVPAADWPACGEVRLDKISVRYDKTLDPVLHTVTASFKPGEKVGICGRTGSGKSSLTLALFRMIDMFEGKICIDGVDISRVPLTLLRSRLSIIPQDPVLFSGTIRFNLDPEDNVSDWELWRSLEIAQLKSVVTELPNQLDEMVTEGGENFSVGQRQLFCLARAFVRKSRILIMDEATASIDMETDAILQDVIKTAFRDRTVLTIAHRIATILNSDRILVLDQGKLVENDSPQNLLKKPDGLFTALVKANK